MYVPARAAQQWVLIAPRQGDGLGNRKVNSRELFLQPVFPRAEAPPDHLGPIVIIFLRTALADDKDGSRVPFYIIVLVVFVFFLEFYFYHFPRPLYISSFNDERRLDGRPFLLFIIRNEKK